MLATQSEGKARRRGRNRVEAPATDPMDDAMHALEQAQTRSQEVGIVNANTQAKFVLFSIPPRERREDGPVMRGFLEIAKEGGEPDKVNVAAWSRVSKEKRTEYLSLKVANTEKPEEGHEGEEPVYTVGPFYGRLFREVTQQKEGVKVRYFGFVEDSEKIGEGEYVTHWQLTVRAKRAVSNDGKTVYISGSVAPSVAHDEHEDDLPF